MQRAGEIPRSNGNTQHPQPLPESNPKVPSDFDSKAPSPQVPFNPLAGALLNDHAQPSSFCPSLAHLPDDAQVVTTGLCFNHTTTKIDLGQKELASVRCQGEIPVIGKSERKQDVGCGKPTMPSAASPSEVMKQHVSSMPNRFDAEAGVTGVADPVSGQGFCESSDPRFLTGARSPRRFHPLASGTNPCIDSMKAPSWPPVLEPAGAVYNLPDEQWPNYGMVGRCPSFGAVPTYLQHHLGFKTEQLRLFEEPVLSNSTIINHQRARNVPVFFPDQLPLGGNGSVGCTGDVGAFRSVDACPTDREALNYDTAMWPGNYRMEEGHCASDGLVGKSQSMRALHCCHKEENEALRRALYSMRKAHETYFPGADIAYLSGAASASSKQRVGRTHVREADVARFNVHVSDRRQDRYVARDAAEGRTVSMRERGKWAAQRKGGAEKAGDGHGFSYPIGGSRGLTSECWCRESGGAAYYGGGNPLYYFGEEEGRWQETDSRLHLGDDWQGRGTPEAALPPTTWLRSMNSEEMEDVRLAAKQQRGRVGGGRFVNFASGVDESRCAMCDGKLRRLRNPSATKKLGLPLRLCPACHPRPAASLPPSITKARTSRSPPPSPPPLHPSSATPPGRHHAAATVATAISLACKPNITSAASSSECRKKSKNRIVDLCRHLVGLSMKPGTS